MAYAIASTTRNGQLGTLYSDGSFVPKQNYSPVPNYTSAVTKKPAYAPPPSNMSPSGNNFSPAPNTSTRTGAVYTPPPSGLGYTPAPTSQPFSFSNALKNIASMGVALTGSSLNLPEMGISESIRGTAQKAFTPLVDLQDIMGIPRLGIMPESQYPKTYGNAGASGFPTPGNTPSPTPDVTRGNAIDSSSLYSSKPQGTGIAPMDEKTFSDWLAKLNESGKALSSQVSDFNTNQIPAYNKNPGSGVDIKPVQGQLDDAYAVILDQYNKGEISAEEAQQKAKDAQLAANETAYGAYKTQAEALIPQYESQYQSGVTDLTNNLTSAKTEAGTQKTNLENTYGGLIRQARATGNQSMVNLKNMLSALGTADSSEFAKRATDLEKTVGNQQASYALEQNNKMAAIDQQVLKLEGDTNNQISTLLSDKNAKIAAVRANIDISEQQKRDNIITINSNFDTALSNLRNSLYNQTASLLSMKAQAQEARNNILTQGAVNSALTTQSYNLQSKLGGIVPTNTGATEADLAALSQQTIGNGGYTGGEKIAALNKLKSLYPSLTDVINGVSLGTRSVDELRQQIMALGQQ